MNYSLKDLLKHILFKPLNFLFKFDTGIYIVLKCIQAENTISNNYFQILHKIIAQKAISFDLFEIFMNIVDGLRI
jgi:hypothetical protein